ncbi:MAG TPA: threonine/serine dehydratase [Thermoflexales bacterium]|jgi:threonine dehydratase|nr:threonine/serine dehydratase [Anaerolineae bacterium]HQV29702.1 threonine/serine dehydratase [Thermoflexales bacterium]HQX10634.1 threonine/serine dehydratase [Thermoflexales bacterium]HQY26195.1 threonine/serine dehydratase [Thermoflexales bacterium]HQZ55020.1 threonine/serine dehydratase [Thermoflexales bacterium]
MDILAAAIDAENRIRPHLPPSPLVRSEALSREVGAEVYLKLESLQPTGSFKVRGALNTVLSLDDAARSRGVITASSGNHGAAVAYALSLTGAPGTVYVPEHASAGKVAAMRRLGATVVASGDDSLLSEHAARAAAQTAGRVYISPYNDSRVVAGQATAGLEIGRALARIDAAFIAVGGGGLVAGAGGALKALHPGIRVIGCQPANSQVMAASVAAGRMLDLPSAPTLSDGTAGGVESDSLTFPLVQQIVDGFELVPEAEIAEAMRWCLAREHVLAEGAAGVAVAALLRQRELWRGKTVVVVICGGNVDAETLAIVLRVG